MTCTGRSREYLAVDTVESEDPFGRRLSEMELSGIITCVTMDKLPLHEPVFSAGKPLSETVSDMRREGCGPAPA